MATPQTQTAPGVVPRPEATPRVDRARRLRSVGFAVAALGLAGVIGLAGCSLRQDDNPRAISPQSLPSALFQDANTSTTAARNPSIQQQSLFLVHTEGTTESLSRVAIPIEAPENPADLPKAIIEKLVLSPPTDAEHSSFIPPGTRVLKVEQRDNLLDIDLSAELGLVESSRQRLAVAQLVFTATAIDGIDFVRFSIDGNPSAVPLDDKTSEVGAMIGRADFPKTRPDAPVTTSTSDPVPQDPTVTDPPVAPAPA